MLSGRAALVTGAADGIGRAVATRFVAEGAAVLFADRREQALHTAVDAVAGEGRRVAMVGDVTDERACDAMAAACVEHFGALDVAVVNAGILRLAPVTDLSAADFRAVVDVNLTGAFLTLRACARVMRAAGRGGRIIVSSSLFGVRSGATNAAYSASKFGVIGLVEAAAADLASDGILVNAVCPGQVDTTMLRDVARQRAAARGVAADVVLGELAGRIPLGRLGTTEDVADTFVYLAGELSGYVTGRHHVVDGGWLVG